MYSPTLGRWMQKDPTGSSYVDGGNLYQMELSNPVTSLDPFGLVDYSNPVYLGPDLMNGTARGKDYRVKTDRGRSITVWKSNKGSQYFCHGFTFGGTNAPNGPYSVLGKDVPNILKDEYSWIPSYMAQSGDTIIFFNGAGAGSVTHSGIVSKIGFQSGKGVGDLDEDATLMDSKWGLLAQKIASLDTNVDTYAKGKKDGYAFYRRGGPLQQCGFGHGAKEKAPPFESAGGGRNGQLPYGPLGPPPPPGYKPPKPQSAQPM